MFRLYAVSASWRLGGSLLQQPPPIPTRSPRRPSSARTLFSDDELSALSSQLSANRRRHRFPVPGFLPPIDQFQTLGVLASWWFRLGLSLCRPLLLSVAFLFNSARSVPQKLEILDTLDARGGRRASAHDHGPLCVSPRGLRPTRGVCFDSAQTGGGPVARPITSPARASPPRVPSGHWSHPVAAPGPCGNSPPPLHSAPA
jgi:hypothetical protein